ncbi:glycerol-3-phosphate acyltransferase [bacterium]|nr:glycerol-3-phosphate acyltransferase [bacterium]
MLKVFIEILLIFIVAYLIGSIPTGYIVVKVAKGEDIRQIGSGSTGATNVKRIMGKKW